LQALPLSTLSDAPFLTQKDGQSLVKVSATANVTAATAAGQVMLRLMNSGSGNDVFLGKYVESSSFIQKL
jgi:hypothetical protein